MAKLVTGTYGEALFELAIEEKKEKEMLLRSNIFFQRFLKRTLISRIH